MKRLCLLLAAGCILLGSCGQPGSTSLYREAARCGISAAKLERIDSVIRDGIGEGLFPGAVVSVVRGEHIVYLKAFGNRQVVPDTLAMTEGTLFDLASVSKCVGTTLSFMQLVEQGLVRLSDRVDRYLPDFQNWPDPETGRQDPITIQDLLTHSSGLPPYLEAAPLAQRFGTPFPDSLMACIAATPRRFKPGTQQLYSCLNFITLQNILQKVTGERLCDYAQRHVFDVLGLEHTCYFPLNGAPACRPDAPALQALCAATEVQEDGLPLVGAVHDPLARLGGGGNSGNAGLFSTAEDLSVVAMALMNGGAFRGRRILGPETVRKMFEIPADNDPCVARALGWDTYALSPGTSGDIFDRSHLVGHTGYTGTSILLELQSKTAVIILTNRVHPADEGNVGRVRGTIANIVAGALEP